jgi:hypothetical protein
VTVGSQTKKDSKMTTTLSIDISRLEKLRQRGDKLQARCPSCATDGSDRRGDHFFANLTTGAWACAARPGDAEHRKAIFALVGIRGERPPDRPDLREVRRREREEAEARAKLAEAARANRRAIVEKWRWDEVDVWESSPQRIDCPLVASDPRWFLQSLFPLDAIVWAGDLFHSGTTHASHWRTVREWQDAAVKDVGPMVAPCTWPTGTTSRTADGVLASPFVTLDFDGFDNAKPTTAKEIEEHIAASLAIIRWLREGLGWKLAACVHTGNKSIHAWFRNPGPAALKSLRETAEALGVDGGLIGRPEHPCRLPGMFHKKTGNRSRVMWLQLPTNDHP